MMRELDKYQWKYEMSMTGARKKQIDDAIEDAIYSNASYSVVDVGGIYKGMVYAVKPNNIRYFMGV